MAVDNYPDEEGHIGDGLAIGFCKCQTTITQNAAVKIHATTVTGYVSVEPSAADADSYSVALKGGVAGEYIPVCFYGIVKMYGGSTITAGDVVMNDASGLFVSSVRDENLGLTPTQIAYYALFKPGGTIRFLGLALQNANSATTGGELLILIGGAR